MPQKSHPRTFVPVSVSIDPLTKSTLEQYAKEKSLTGISAAVRLLALEYREKTTA